MPVDRKETAFEATIEHHMTTADEYVKSDRTVFISATVTGKI